MVKITCHARVTMSIKPGILAATCAIGAFNPKSTSKPCIGPVFKNCLSSSQINLDTRTR